MAMHDWNRDGKKDGMDTLIEYQIYKNPTNRNSGNYGGGTSTLGAILISFSGLFGQALLYTLLDINVENVPVVVMIILWIVISTGVAVAVEALKR